ncbi:disease resistance RPP13-like protein 4 [Magnolia sinica]|uniref:disease resistance RPP13-like protein 4 n=1 Tax=Magnolia sinica TaxID=86752 RepID=UPI002659F84C|nr:disease resistance RPP13-like protein 4 [Magnolia sinica]
MKEKDQVEITLESNPNELRLLFNLSAQYLSCNKEQLARLKLIYTLLLGRWQNLSRHHIEVEDTKFLDGLQSLKGLRYLSLQGISRITELPKTITGLTNLLILDLRLCHNLENVTAAVTSIKSLTHLDVSECYLLDKMPQGIGSMTNLQVLKGFVVGSARSTDQCRLSELTHLKKLWKLSIRIGSEAQIGEDLNELSEIEKLRSLKIAWGHMKSSPSEYTKPKTSRTFSLGKLEKLVLECVPDDDSEEIKLSQLSLVSEDVRWNVEILRLKFLKELKLEWNYMKRELIQLRCAQIYKCPKIGSSLPGFDENGFWVDETRVPITRTNLELPSDDNA